MFQGATKDRTSLAHRRADKRETDFTPVPDTGYEISSSEPGEVLQEAARCGRASKPPANWNKRTGRQ
jgi:hypothetical protein